MRSSNATQLEPIQASWKISDVIGRYPQLVDESGRIERHFSAVAQPGRASRASPARDGRSGSSDRAVWSQIISSPSSTRPSA